MTATSPQNSWLGDYIYLYIHHFSSHSFIGKSPSHIALLIGSRNLSEVSNEADNTFRDDGIAQWLEHSGQEQQILGSVLVILSSHCENELLA